MRKAMLQRELVLALVCLFQYWLVIRGFSCPRMPDGSQIMQPTSISSTNGLLEVDVIYESRFDENGIPLFCFMMPDGINQSPSLRVKPGDTILFTVTNNFPGLGNEATDHSTTKEDSSDMAVGTNSTRVSCGAKRMTSSSVNVHFHGLHVSPTCHEDETIDTLINFKDVFTYEIKVPLDQQPGLYLYHPHVHTLSEAAILGGASGIIIVEGIENIRYGLAGLPQQTMVIRDHAVSPSVEAMYPNSNGTVYDLSINYVTNKLPASAPAVFRMKPLEKQVWLIANAGANSLLNLQFLYDGVLQPFDVASADSDILTNENGVRNFELPPGGRAYIIITGPPQNVQRAVMQTKNSWTGNNGNLETTRDILQIIPDVNAREVTDFIPKNTTSVTEESTEKLIISQVDDLQSTPLAAKHTLYFYQVPKNNTFYITEVGKPQVLFDPSVEPALTATSGTVEEWIIQNRAQEGKYGDMIYMFFFTIIICFNFFLLM